MYLSVVIPAYNEASRLGLTLKKLNSFLSCKDYDYEVIIVDDGSTDGTSSVASESTLSKSGKLSIIKNNRNKGKGFSVRKGMASSKGDYVLFTDADLSTPIEELDKLFSYIGKGFDAAIGSRSIKGANIQAHQPFYREYMGKLFNKIVRLFVLRGIIDTQCGFKLFKKTLVKDILPYLNIEGFAFDVEILYLAGKKGYSIKEVPIVWLDSPASKVNAVSDSLRMLMDILSIKRLHNGKERA